MPGAMVAEPGERVPEAVYFDTAGLDLTCALAMMTYRRQWRMLDADGVLPADAADDRVVARWASGDALLAWRAIEVELGERGDNDRRRRPGRTVWGAVQAVGRLVVWELGKLVACRMVAP